MKKIILLLCLAGLSFSTEKKYKFEFTLPELQAIMYVIDQSNAPHGTVKQVQAIFNKQYQAQDTTKIKNKP